MSRDDQLERVMSPLRHEMRNTLSPITMVVDMLVLRGGDPEIDVLARAVQVLALHVEDLASLSHEAHAHLEVNLRSVELSGVVTTTSQAVARHLAQTGASLEIDVPAKLHVQADAACLALALASAIRHCALRSRKLALSAGREGTMVVTRIVPDNHAVPAEPALVFARRLVELQRGTVTVGNDLRLSLPIASIR